MSKRDRKERPIIGTGLSTCLEQVGYFARKDIPVLIVGETGTGKEGLSREYGEIWCKDNGLAIERYAAVNCTGKPDDVLLGDLFGVVKGAFTGAGRDRNGYIHEHRILCLDEIGDAGPRFQAAILRVVEYGEYSRLGSNTTELTAVRFIASTNKLHGIREDLAYRFHKVEVPPLHSRPEDMIEMVKEFAGEFDVNSVTKRFIAWAGAHVWPGNVRELLVCFEEASRTGTTAVRSTRTSSVVSSWNSDTKPGK